MPPKRFLQRRDRFENMNKFTVKNLNLWYNDFKALKNVNLELNAPQLTMLARKLNNSGKFNIPDGVFDIENMKNVIISQLRGDSENV